MNRDGTPTQWDTEDEAREEDARREIEARGFAWTCYRCGATLTERDTYCPCRMEAR